MLVDVFFFFNDTATTEIYTLSLHDALPICQNMRQQPSPHWPSARIAAHIAGCGLLKQPDHNRSPANSSCAYRRSEEHTSELQSRQYLVCRLLLEKKKPLILTALLFLNVSPS